MFFQLSLHTFPAPHIVRVVLNATTRNIDTSQNVALQNHASVRPLGQLLFNRQFLANYGVTMDIEITFAQFNELTSRLDQEVCAGLQRKLESQHGIYVVEQHRLGDHVIFSVHTDQHRIEILSAFIPLRRKIEDLCTIQPTLAKFLCIRHHINPNELGWWHVDQRYGDRGYATFCVNPLDIDGIQTFIGVLAKHILEHLIQIHA